MTPRAPEPRTETVCAILVTYRPDRGLPERIRRILPQVHGLIVVDNGSDADDLEMLRELAAMHASITLKLNGANLGVARALNIGIDHAEQQHFAWVLLLDQDSEVDANMVQALFAVYAAHPLRDQLAVIGAGFSDVNRESRQWREEPSSAAWVGVESAITSGSLIPLTVHRCVGPFRDEFFIDYVDSEYCFRARARGYRVITTRRAVMSHAIGAASRHNILGMSKWTTNHSPDRRYYIARNDTVMLREYGDYHFGLWALKSLSRSLRLCKRIVLYERMKREKLTAVAQGWWDGIRGRLGPRDAEHAR
jgi:rhamnosyltransferase